MTTERPILFNAPMVRAILNGQKTQTRRIVDQRKNPHDFLGGIGDDKDDPYNYGYENPDVMGHFVTIPEQRCPYGRPGDRLWVRETWQTHCDMDHITPRDLPRDAPIQYPATYDGWVSRKWPSIHMPRWASRITLEITDVRVERLQSISEEDACAEGVEGNPFTTLHSTAFEQLWRKINGPESWDKNPFVWVIGFKMVSGGE